MRDKAIKYHYGELIHFIASPASQKPGPRVNRKSRGKRWKRGKHDLIKAIQNVPLTSAPEDWGTNKVGLWKLEGLLSTEKLKGIKLLHILLAFTDRTLSNSTFYEASVSESARRMFKASCSLKISFVSAAKRRRYGWWFDVKSAEDDRCYLLKQILAVLFTR